MGDEVDLKRRFNFRALINVWGREWGEWVSVRTLCAAIVDWNRDLLLVNHMVRDALLNWAWRNTHRSAVGGL